MGINLPTFFGYFTAHRGLLAGQAALNTINHNITNVNTDGFSRQRVDLETTTPYASPTKSNYIRSGQMGQGVQVEGISRSHDNFLDGQIRIQNSLSGYQTTVRDTLQQVEGILGEPSGSSVNAAVTDYFAAAQALSVHPDALATRANFIQSAQNLLDVFQQQANQLQDLRTNITGDSTIPGSFATSQVALTAEDINADLSEIANLNSQILTVEAGGAAPNDLLDRRDHLLNELSKKINITVETTNYDQVNVKLGTNVLVRGVDVLDTLSVVANPAPPPASDDTPALVNLTNAGITVNADITGGELGGLLQSGGNSGSSTTIRSVLESLDTVFDQIATNINGLQATGLDYNGAVPVPPDDQIFIPGAPIAGLNIFNYSVNGNIIADPNLIAAADGSGPFAGVGDGRNASLMAQLETQSIAGLGNTTFHQYVDSLVSKLGIDSKAAQNSSENLNIVIQGLEQRRQSVQGVNLEEEMIDLLRFQRGFEASAKVMSTMDHIVDTLINRIF